MNLERVFTTIAGGGVYRCRPLKGVLCCCLVKQTGGQRTASAAGQETGGETKDKTIRERMDAGESRKQVCSLGSDNRGA